MKYEKKNNIGILLMMAGTILLVLSLFLPSRLLLIAGGVIAAAMLGAGLYMMTRGFTELDKDHPDYNRYQDMKEQKKDT